MPATKYAAYRVLLRPQAASQRRVDNRDRFRGIIEIGEVAPLENRNTKALEESRAGLEHIRSGWSLVYIIRATEVDRTCAQAKGYYIAEVADATPGSASTRERIRSMMGAAAPSVRGSRSANNK